MKNLKKLLTLAAALACLMMLNLSVFAAGKIYVNMDSNLRRGPGKDYSVYTSVEAGKTLTYLNDTDEDDRGIDWYNVSYKGKSLWISSRCASKTSKPYTSASKRVITKAEVNIRKGAGLKYGVIATVQKGSAFKYLGKTSKDGRGVKWYKISYYGRNAWVSSKYSYRKNVSSSKYAYTWEDANLREGPGMEYDPPYASVTEGTVLKYLNSTKKDDRGVKWYKVSYKGKSVWISSKTCYLK